ncbi:pfkB family carbohydrate kinase [Brevibacterium sp. 239c]|uniref:hypothetical protein n=1 Tax=Brevibacterium sp. 239c TaxID=1965356 RepID=UPI000C4AAF28|nr:hypothetical protein [Brevibacterium sp. 239c]SMX99929.1 pfkB family carbohydrate kinase [Brevibacterium sp. 239c]
MSIDLALTVVGSINADIMATTQRLPAAGENQIAVCEGANAHVSLAGREFHAHESVLTQLEISLDLIKELSHSVRGRFVINAAPALPLPAEVVERADLIIVNETEYDLLPQLPEAKLVAVTYGSQGSALYEHGRQVAFAKALPRSPVNTVGAEAVMDPSSQPDFHQLEDYLRSVASTDTEATSTETMT